MAGIVYTSDITTAIRISGTAKRTVVGGGTTTQPLDINVTQLFSKNGVDTFGGILTYSWGGTGATNYAALSQNETVSVVLQSNAVADAKLTPQASTAFRGNISSGTLISKVYAIFIDNNQNGALELTFTVASALGQTSIVTHSGTAPTTIKILVPAGGTYITTCPAGWDVTDTYDTFTLKALGTDAGQVDLQLIVGTTS